MVTNVLVFRPPAENSARGEEESGTLSPSSTYRPHTLILTPLSSLSCLNFFFHLLSLLSLPPTLLPSLQPFCSLSLPPSLLPLSLLPPSRLLYYPLFNPSPLSPSPPPSLPLFLSPSFLQLNEVMEKETYNTAREILERFDPSHPSLHAPNPARQNQERQPNTPRSGSGQSCVASSEDTNSSY